MKDETLAAYEAERSAGDLPAREDHYRSLFECMNEGFALCEILCDALGNVHDFRYLAVNPAFERHTGLSAAQVTGRTILELFPEIEREWFEQCGKTALTGVSARFEAWFGLLGRWFEVSCFQTTPGRFGALFTDISKFKREGTEYRMAGELQAILEATPAAIWIAHDPECRRITGNAYADEVIMRAERGGNISRSALPGDEAVSYRVYRNGVELAPGELPSQVAAATGQPVKEQGFELVFNDGRRVHTTLSAVPLFDADGRVRGSVTAGIDITRLKQAEETLRASEEKYRLLFESSIDGIILTSPDGYISAANSAACRILGRTEEEIIQAGREGITDTSDPRLAAALEERDRTGRFHGELTMKHKDGSLFPAEISTVLYGGKDSETRSSVLFRDITERKRAEERLREVQKLESLGLLAGGIAHDFNNLLVSVIGNASLAQERLPAGHPLVELLERVVQSGHQAAHLTNQMLAYSGKGKFLVETLNLSALIADMGFVVQESISPRIAIHFQLEENLPPIEADRGQMKQVFMNLATNAADAIGSRDGLIIVKTGIRNVDGQFIQRRQEARDLMPGRYVYLDVSDSGCGMDEATRARIFDPFYSTKFMGRGLGLAAVGGIVRGHKGTVTVSSQPGQGSCFTVLLPATEYDIEELAPGLGDALPKSPGTILVVDDERMVRDLVKQALEDHGYTVLLAESGPMAIDVMKSRPGGIDLVLLDLSMPGMSGAEVLPEIRKILPDVKVMLSSGYSEAESMQMFEGQQVSAFLQKPFTLNTLRDAVKDCIG
uniref:histidine kinase n=1 Tax=Solibacter usitatus (strain Ellin6076) TaxID=234267 RepID=Q022C0_SOLUE